MRSLLRPLALGALLLPAVLAGQGRATKLVEAALAQLKLRNLDSAEALLRPVVDSVIRAMPRERGVAFLLLGVIDFQHGRDSAAASDFRRALAATLMLRGEWLAGIDSSLGALWKRERGRAICGWSGSDSSRAAVPDDSVAQKPKILSGPTPRYPEHLRRAGVTGRVLLAAIVDTTGRAEPGSIKILASPHQDLSREAHRYLERARFQPARNAERAVRVCVEVPVDFKIRGY